MILSDVDGVLTNGNVYLGDAGDQIIQFHVRDGLGIRLWRNVGGLFGFVTGRDIPAVRRRAEMLKIDYLRQGVGNKLPIVDEIIDEAALNHDQVCFIGDDLLDLAVIQSVGLGIAVANAVEEVRAVADYVTSVSGGHGAVREAIDMILKNSDRWENALGKLV